MLQDAHAHTHNKRRQTINQNDSVEKKRKKKKGGWLDFGRASINQLVGERIQIENTHKEEKLNEKNAKRRRSGCVCFGLRKKCHNNNESQNPRKKKKNSVT